jgi:hydrogenase/urease accessory protein HupE
MRQLRYVLLVVLALLVMQRSAQAHLVTTGLGPVYDGIGHFSIAPDDSIPVVALALFAGLRGKRAGRGVMFQLPLAWFCGGVAGLMAHREPFDPLRCVSFLVLGVLVAADLPLPDLAVMALGVAMGFMHGFLDGAGFQAAGLGKGMLQLLGISAILFVLTPLVSALVVSIRTYWVRIVMRVAGSWIAAIGLLMLGWALRLKHY